MRNRKMKRSRSSSLSRKKASSNRFGDYTSNSRGSYVDLMVMKPKKTDAVSSLEQPQQLMVEELFERLESTGFSVIALTHTVYGTPRPQEDQVEQALGNILSRGETGGKRKRPFSLTVVRRLHAVVENLSDVGMYANQSEEDESPHASLLKEYDLVSISPRNDAAFQAACVSATAADIITLDYTAGRGLHLPFKIRSSDAKAAVRRNAIFEIPYAPAVLNRAQRKGFVQTCRELQTACAGLKPRVLIGSGPRLLADSSEDAGAMAVRTPGDLINLLQVVGGFDTRTSVDALGKNGFFALEQARKRRFGNTTVVDVSVEDVNRSTENEPDNEDESKIQSRSDENQAATNQDPDASDEEKAADGFISFS